MRVRILKPSAGVVDGVPLAQLIPGVAYDVAASVGQYLVTCKCAEELLSTEPAIIIPFNEAGAFDGVIGGARVVREAMGSSLGAPLMEIADRPLRHQRSSRRRRKRR